MIASMTAFGRIEENIEYGRVIWEIRTVNHRYMEINLRLPDELRMLDNLVRQRISETIKRGKVDCTMKFDASARDDMQLSLNESLAHKVIKAVEGLRKDMYDPATVNPMDILRWPGVIERESLDVDTISEAMMGLLDKTLVMVKETRVTEGQKIRDMISERCNTAKDIVAKLRDSLPGITESIRDKLRTRVMELTKELDRERLEQEVVLLAQKSDVAEELDRLDAHITEVLRVLDESKPVGRRLDFLMQEMNRESNTLGSKAADINMTNASVELKVLIEQMREQIQNIE